MDYRLNNEAIVACVVAQVVNHGCKKLSVVVQLTALLMVDSMRNKAKQAERAEIISDALRLIDGGLLTIIMNSITLLVKGDCMSFANDELNLTQNGMTMCKQMRDKKSEMLAGIVKDIPAIIGKIEAMKITMDIKYVITL